LDSNGVPVEAVAKYMKHLYNTEKSSKTLQTYCTALKYYFIYLEQIDTYFQQVDFELLSNFVAWLRNPFESSNVIPHKKVKEKRSERTVNNYISAVTNFYDYSNRNDLIDSDIVDKLMKKMFVGAVLFLRYLLTVLRDIPSIVAICLCDKPSTSFKNLIL
jgi:integrase/recombinase XerD